MDNTDARADSGWRVGQLADLTAVTDRGGALELDADGRAVHGELFAGDQSIWLHPSGNGYRSSRDLQGHLWYFHSPID